MFEKRICHALFSRIAVGGLRVTYWDGRIESYGPDRPWVHVELRSPGTIRALARDVDLHGGEAYMNGEIEVEGDLAQLVRLAGANGERLAGLLPAQLRRPLQRARALAHHRSHGREAADVRSHYDLGNDFYRLWLDRSMTYSCAYFRSDGDTLEQAQRQKVEHILRKLAIEPGMRLLDIGSGWGELIVTAAKRYGARAHGITLSPEQLRHTRERIAAEGLQDRVSVELRHYADLGASESFDRVVSVGMFEHVGAADHGAYMAAVDRALRPGGVSLLHTITQTDARPAEPWIDRYIFPGGYLPTVAGIFALLPAHDFRPCDYESLRRHYARTLQAWWERFEAAAERVREMYDERFVRMWRLYLRGAFAGFRYGRLDLAQVVWTKGLADTLPMTRDYMYPPVAAGQAGTAVPRVAAASLS